MDFYREFPAGERGRKYHSEYIPELRTDNKRCVPNGISVKRGHSLDLSTPEGKVCPLTLFRLPTEPAHVIVPEDSVLYYKALVLDKVNIWKCW